MVELNSKDEQKMTYEKLFAMKQVILEWRRREAERENKLLQEIRDEEETKESNKVKDPLPSTSHKNNFSSLHHSLINNHGNLLYTP